MSESARPGPMPLVYAVVLTWNDYGETAECLRSLRKVSYPGLKVILVDNNSDDGSDKQLRREFTEVEMIPLRENRGYSAGNNAGILRAMELGAEYIVVLNNDVVVDPGFLEPLVEAASRSPRIGVVAGKVFYKSDPEMIYAAGGHISFWKCTGVNGRQWERETEPDPEERESEITFANGCLILIRRSVFEECGLFAEHFFLYFDDIEYSRRITPRFSIRYTPHSRAYHKSGAGVRWGSYTPKYLYYHTRSRILAFRDDRAGYRLYVLLYTLANVVVKSVAITLASLRGAGTGRPGVKVGSLWRGFVDGLTGRGPRG